MEISDATFVNIRQNLVGAFIYNVIGIPVAAGVLFYPFGILLKPVYAGGGHGVQFGDSRDQRESAEGFQAPKAPRGGGVEGTVGVRMMPIDVVLVNVGAVLAIVWIVWYFWMSGEDSAG